MKMRHDLEAGRKPLYAAIVSSVVGVGYVGVLAADVPGNPSASPNALVVAAACNPCNPCAAKNPCNPCAAKSPCNPCNPCAAKNPCNPCNPCAAKNPCNPCAAACNPCNPCGPCAAAKVNPCKVMRPAGKSLKVSDSPSVLAEGKRLWNDTSLSTNGLACQSCHVNDMSLNATFAEPYPHRVAMPYQRAGVDEVHVDEMVQFCMVVPMQAEPFAWDSKELMALSSYTLALQTAFNPCAAKNPCAANPCNPCNPCAAKNPCNPCAAKNPCNPCAAQ